MKSKKSEAIAISRKGVPGRFFSIPPHFNDQRTTRNGFREPPLYRERKLAEEKKKAWKLRTDKLWDAWYKDLHRICVELRQAGYVNPSILLFNDEHRLWGTTICSDEGCDITQLHCADIPSSHEEAGEVK